MRIVIATSNVHKLQEIKKLLPESFDLIGLNEIGQDGPVPETGHTFTENALQKARFIFDKCGLPVIADDSGLEVEALDGRPGIYSARYSGLMATDDENVNKLLGEMEGISNRKARFVAVIALIVNGSEYCFQGVVNGSIAISKSGAHGFGYDPVFIPEGYECTFAELPGDIKNQISHRGKAVGKLVSFLEKSAF